MLQTKTSRADFKAEDYNILASDAFCCFSAKLSGSAFCGTCWPGAKAASGSWCATESRCGQCGGTWCAGGSAPKESPTPPTPVPTRAPTPLPTVVPTSALRPLPTPRPTPAPLPASTPAPTLPAAECSDDGSDCRTTMCCEDSSMRCYEKNEYWAGCK